jgi:uncharacterized RDD family membrane protein YckC
MRNERHQTVPDQPGLEPGVDFVPAAPVTRLLAWLLDAAASVIVTLALYRFLGGTLRQLLGFDSFLGKTLELTFLFMGMLGYWAVVPAVTGSTPGRMLFGLRIVPERDRPLGLEQVVLHEVLGPVLTVASAGLGFLTAFRDPKGRTLADRLAGVRTIQFTPPRNDLYQAQDLRTDPATGRLISELLGSDMIPAAKPAGTETPEPSSAPASAAEPSPPRTPASEASPPSGSADTAAEAAGPEAPGGAAPAASGARPTPVPPRLPPAAPRAGGTLYTRPEGETAYERRIRAAQGPGLAELAAALRNTVSLVEAGSVMPKVLERKRREFIEQMEKVHLGPDPQQTIRLLVALGRDHILSREELQQVHAILKRRLARPG